VFNADVAIPARDRKRLERLCRYVARPPLALDRPEELRDGRLAYRLKMPWRDGTPHVVMERRKLLERLAPLVPPPRVHQVRYTACWLHVPAAGIGWCGDLWIAPLDGAPLPSDRKMDVAAFARGELGSASGTGERSGPRQKPPTCDQARQQP
jgi:hypothetical protein